MSISSSSEDLAVQFVEKLLITNPDLVYLENFPEVLVVVRNDYYPDIVALIAKGCRGGLEAKMVSDRQLAAAVYGEKFALPSEGSIRRAIQEVTGDPGSLVIVKEKDLKHFTQAAQKASTEGYQVEVISTKKLAETIAVAGAAAAAGSNLQLVKKEAKAVNSGITRAQAKAAWNTSINKRCIICGISSTKIKDVRQFHRHFDATHKNV